MINDSVSRLLFLTETIPPLLHAMDDAEFSARPLPNKWSKKEIIGHLIDSASNNHHRFIRGQFEKLPALSYNQDKWNESGHYQISYRNCYLKSEFSAGTGSTIQYEVCDADGTFELTLKNKENKTIIISDGTFEMYSFRR